MKQIKTILEPIERAKYFDIRVNCAVIDGWTLTKRKIITSSGEITEAFNATIQQWLYAEMEKPFFEEVTF